MSCRSARPFRTLPCTRRSTSGGTYDEFRDVTCVHSGSIEPRRCGTTPYRSAYPAAHVLHLACRRGLVICSSSGFAHGIRTEGRKIVYCHSPPKWLYRHNDYLGAHRSKSRASGFGRSVPFCAPSTAGQRRGRPYIANSTFVAAEIPEAYGIEAEVVFPPAGLGMDGPARRSLGSSPASFSPSRD